jgi:hypothetical protein
LRPSIRTSVCTRKTFVRLTANVSSKDGSSSHSFVRRYSQSHLSFISFAGTDASLGLQELLAESFEATTLFEDALIQYDELEACFFQNLKGPLSLPRYLFQRN